jgi:hypothetical protein
MDNKYYKEIDEVLKTYEEYKPYHDRDIDWAANRISWAWKWKKITEEQMEELAERATKIYEEGVF